MKRYSDRPFPAYLFIPGKNPHPKKSGGHMEGELDPVLPRLTQSAPFANEALCYALDLYNFGYYWESHVYFEALWNAHGRVGDIADFLKGMIKLGAAGVKFNLGQVSAAKGHLQRARELFEAIAEKNGTHFLGFSLEMMMTSIDTALTQGVKCPVIHPEWSVL
jgi:uncharacterized protein